MIAVPRDGETLTQIIITEDDFNIMYEKYGASLFGILLKFTDGDYDAAILLLNETFAEFFDRNCKEIKTGLSTFSLLLQALLQSTGYRGYQTPLIRQYIFK